MAFSSSSSTSSEINVTPLIDVLLVLLVIFMVIAPEASRGLDSELPQKSDAASSRPAPVMVRLVGGDTGEGLRYLVGAEYVAGAELESRMRGLFSTREDRTVFVEAGAGASYGQVTEVVAKAKLAGAGSVALSRSGSSE